MKPIQWTSFVFAILACFLGGKAHAQFPGAYGGFGGFGGYGYAAPSRVSPYLNLLRSGSAPGVNYYGLVRPEFEFRRNIGQLQAQNFAQQQAITGLQTAPTTVTTGHPVGFQNHLGYFQNLSALGAGPFTGGTTQPRGGTGATGTTGGTTGRGSPPPRSGR
jgi:hypothetical protein